MTIIGAAGRSGSNDDAPAVPLQQDLRRDAARGRAAGDGRQVDDGDDLAADIGHTQHVRRGVDHLGQRGHDHDLAHLEDIDAVRFPATGTLIYSEEKQQDLQLVGTRQLGSCVDAFQ